MIKKLLTSLAILCAVARAQVPVTPATIPHVTFVNGSGAPCAGCTLTTYTAGTTTPFPTYTDSTGTSVNTNPIILDAAGGANIWVGRHSYKFILKDALGLTIWTVDNVNEGNLSSPCGPAGSVQIANTSVTGMDCDSSIFVNKLSHTLNIGTIGAAHVVIAPLGVPTLWTFDTTSPATALASLGGSVAGAVGVGTMGQIPYYAAPGNSLSATSAIPNGITATTQSPSDNSTKIATTAYVQTPGAIGPTSLKVATGVPMTGNQGNGILVQHSTGTTTTDDCAKFDANGNTVDSGTSCAAGTPRTCSASGCYRIEPDGTIEQWGVATGCSTSSGVCTPSAITFPFAFTTTTNLAIQTSCYAAVGNCAIAASSVSTTGFTPQVTALVQVSGSGANLTTQISWSAKGN